MSESRDYYVSMRKSEINPAYMLMAGPFETHDQALKMVDPTRKEASRLDPWSDFYFFGTCSMPRRPENKAGWLNTYLGISADQTVVPSAQRGEV